MIIPPDPEKDPRIFDPSASTHSLVEAPSEFDETTSRWDGESLPPYERRRSSRGSIHSSEENIFSDHYASRQPPNLIIHNLPTQPQQIHNHSPASSSSTLTPRPSLVLPHLTHRDNNTSTFASTSKLWENPDPASTTKRQRKCGCLPIPPAKLQRWWKRWKRWVQAIVVLVLIGIGLVVGLLVGMNKGETAKPPIAPWQRPWMDQDTDGKRVAAWAGNGSFNLTYVEPRDAPSPSEGNLTDCNNFTLLNLTSSPFTTLFTPFPRSTVSLASFSFPLTSSGTAPKDLFVNARGFGSSGTLQIVGSDGPEAVLMSGEEGKILIDVVVRYSGQQDLNTMMRVCKMTRGEDGVGVGIYSPKETDGKMANPFKLNPNMIPTNLVIIRLPPSAYNAQTPSLEIPSFSLDAEHMVVRLGKLSNVVSFDTLNLDTNRGGVEATYAQVKKGSIVAFEGNVRGTWNVSETLIVNVTDGSIQSDVILFDSRFFDNSTTIAPPTSDYTVFRRTPSAMPSTDSNDTSGDDDDFEDEVHALLNSTTSGNSVVQTNDSRPNIVTNLFTTSGYVDVRYLSQPSSIDLSAIIGTQQGNMAIKFHPNYVGPFIARTTWGQINIPSPSPINDLDPQGKHRYRSLLIDPIEVKANTTFAVLGYTQQGLEESCDTISGYAYWAGTKWMEGGEKAVLNKTMSQLQNDGDGNGNDNQVIVLGDWGNVDITFDGQ
ncbi:hypothetical protein I302_108547 [Kwoniella bestiolae CBS 10118]|uniref:Uncharacterized protein n=1 Tax=Kwoniella bestiolae CBS 10118 TaxID=1296100 RepID=A0A1B9FVE1_9TREE|nr:hypothetical protein I302_07080 [Kwoniella bestiolae CBS 10118]OCF22740.1 hypothetical protein I302_07080 [Kwoniella bestiolae CBS 10118]